MVVCMVVEDIVVGESQCRGGSSGGLVVMMVVVVNWHGSSG